MLLIFKFVVSMVTKYYLVLKRRMATLVLLKFVVDDVTGGESG